MAPDDASGGDAESPCVPPYGGYFQPARDAFDGSNPGPHDGCGLSEDRQPVVTPLFASGELPNTSATEGRNYPPIEWGILAHDGGAKRRPVAAAQGVEGEDVSLMSPEHVSLRRNVQARSASIRGNARTLRVSP